MKFEMGGIYVEVRGLKGFSTLIGLGLTAAAVVQELKQPPEERDWHGRVLGVVPYDFRPPTPGRVRDEFWDPDSQRVLTPHAFGVGWGVNFGAIARKLDLVA